MKLVKVRLRLYDNNGYLIDARCSEPFFSDKLIPGQEKTVFVTWDNVLLIADYYSKLHNSNRCSPFSLEYRKQKIGLELKWNIHFIDPPLCDSLHDLKQCNDPINLKFVMTVVETVPDSIEQLFKMKDFESSVRYLKKYMDNLKE